MVEGAMVSQEFIMQLIGMAGVGIGVYAGIRADIATLHCKVDTAMKAAERAHSRLDGQLKSGGGSHD